MENINALAVEIREISQANGWDSVYRPDWTSSNDMIPCRLALIHSEICEAHGAFHTGDFDNLEAEFADIIIRVLDLADGLTEDFEAHVARLEGAFLSDNVEQAFNFLHNMTTYALEAFRSDDLLKFLGALALLLFSVECWALGKFGINMDVAVPEKMDVNRHRSYRHGGKRV
jgi:NTP pyrophosphatase (non-canonical NTP hydrolase)